MKRIHPSGFTLVELIIAIGIIAILALLTIPSYQTYIANNRLIGAANNLFYGLNVAKSEAIKRNTNVYVSFQTGANWCYGMNSDSTCSCNIANSCNLGVINYTSTSGLTLSASGLSGTSLRFESNHGATGTNTVLTFTVTGGSSAMSLKVSLLGNIQICSNQITGYQTCS